MPTIKPPPRRRARVHQRPHAPDGRIEADEDRLADQEMADVELGQLGDGGDRRRRSRSRCRGRRGPPGPAPRPGRRRRAAPPAAASRLRRAARAPPGNRRRCAARPPGRRPSAAAAIWPGSASMNSDTRMPAAFRPRPRGRCGCAGRATSRPPSVVTSSRRSGTRQAACGRWRRAIACISSVTAISKFSGRPRLRVSAARASMSASEMCRRSSRRWAVMPSAPAAMAISAARAGSG